MTSIVRDYVAFLARTLLFLEEDSTSPRPSKPLFRVSKQVAEKVASDRRRFVEGILKDADELVDWDAVELPPEFDSDLRTDRRLEHSDAVAQTVNLRAQLNNAQTALFGRVVDTVVAILRQHGMLSIGPERNFLEGAIVDLALQAADGREDSTSQYPWSVVVGTNRPDIFVRGLSPLRNWLGIGVNIAAPLRSELYWSCLRSSQSTGTVAGRILHRKSIYALTCAHVAPTCNCYGVKGKFDGAHQPDAVLIPINSNCLTLNNTRFSSVAVATPTEILEAAKKPSGRNDRWKKVRRIGGESWRTPGRVLHPLTTYPDDKKFGYFATAWVTGFRWKILKFIPWPLFRRNFSRRGDSGSWVVREDSGSWVGMVVGGDTDAGISFVIRAPELIQFFQHELKEDPSKTGVASGLVAQLIE